VPTCRGNCREGPDRHLRYPTYAATNYGYIQVGAQLNGAFVREVAAFVEKPDTETATKYVDEEYLWNSGNLLFHAGTMWKEIEQLEPLMAQAVRASVTTATRDLDFLRLAPEPFARAPKKSIDYAVMERTKRAAVVPADLGWSDIGSWSTVWDVLDHDAAGNATAGPVVLSDTRNSLVRSEESILTTVIGLEDIVVVATSDAVLITPRARAEEVKGLVERLKAQNHPAASTAASTGHGDIIRM
jgi:mannose-1-phosphate guanylyltransferase/mannose-6-phosphate isomerase